MTDRELAHLFLRVALDEFEKLFFSLNKRLGR
jgi:hypothetical protein